MRKLFTLLIVMLLLTVSSWAATVQIGSGTTTSSYFPIYSCYGYNYSQQIYLGSEISAAGGIAGNITKIRFFYSSSGTTYANWKSWTVYLGNTSKTIFASTTDWEPVGSMTQVFSGDIPTPVAGTWLEIILSTPFAYTGGNLLVAVDENTAGYSCTATFRSFDSGTNRGILYYSDGTNPDPAAPPTANYGPSTAIDQIQFEMPTATPSLSISPLTMAFGYVPYGTQSASQTYTMSGVNLVASPVVVTAPTGFEVSLNNATWTGTVDVTFTPPTLANTTVYVRCNPLAADAVYSGNVTNVCGTATGDVAVTGSSSLYSAYCVSSATSAADEEIFNVTVGTINNTSDCNTLAPGVGSVLKMYSNYYFDVAPADLARTSSPTFSVQIGTCGGSYSNAVKIFIDYNQDGDFADAEEEVYVSALSTAGPHFETGSFTVPVGATLGNTMMRVVNVETGTPSGITACGTYSWGETEDYKVNITAAPACPQPAALTAGSITSNSANLSWTPTGAETVWEYAYGVAPFATPASGTISYSSITNPTGSLLANTAYQFYVRAVCDPENDPPVVSTWSGPKSFTTLCDPFTALSENFDAVTIPALPSCWKMFSSYSGATVTTVSTTYYSSPYCAQLYCSGATAVENILLITPTLSNLGAGTHELRFFAKSSSVLATSVVVGTMTDPANGATFTPFQTVTINNTAFAEYVVSFASYAGSDNYIAFRHPCETTYSYIYLDNVIWHPIPSCPQPTGLTTAGVTATTAELNWTNGGTETLWNVKYGPPGFNPETEGTLISDISSHTPYYLLNPPLASNTTYDWYVQANCGSKALSPWSGPGTFHTLCGALSAFPYTQSFGATLTDCWAASEGAAGASIHWATTTADASHGVIGPYAGTHFAFLNVYNAQTTYNPYYLTTLEFALGATPRQLKYYYWLGDDTDPAPLTLQVSTDNGANWTDLYAHTAANSVFSGTNALTGWTLNTVILSGYVNQTVKFRFKSISNYGNYSCNQAIDEFVIENAPALGALQGHVYDPSGEEAISGATVSFSTFSTTTDVNGYYNFPYVPVGTYDVTCTATGYITTTATGINVTAGGTATHDFYMQYQLDPPEGLAAVVQNNVDVHLTWRAPGSPSDQWIHWDNGISSHSIGSAGAGTWDPVVRFPVADIAPYDGMHLTKIRFYATSYAANSTEIRIWTGPNPATLVYQQPLASVTLSAWNEITLTTPLLIDGTQELWFGYEIDYNAGMYPAGTDAGPAATDKNWIQEAGSWFEMAVDVGLNYNWNIQGWVSNAKGAEMMLMPVVEKANPVGSSTPEVSPIPRNPYHGSIQEARETLDGMESCLGEKVPAYKIGSNQVAPESLNPMAPLSTWPVLGYNVYRGGTKLNTVPVVPKFYDNTGLAPGTYSYTVKAVYPQGESPTAAGPVEVTINACFAPTLLTVSDLNSTGATFSWTPGGAPTDWIVEYGPTGFAHGSGTSVPVSGTPSLPVSTLSPGVSYDVYVRTDCGGGSLSDWTGPQTFFTRIECPVGSIAEAEACGDDTNGGCNMTVPAWEPLACGESVCGTAWADGLHRDTDWYSFTLTQPTNVTLSGQAEFGFLLGLIDGRSGCPVTGFMVYASGTARQVKSVSIALGAGTYYAWFGPSATSPVIACGAYDKYWATLDCNTNCVQPVDLGVQNVTLSNADLVWTTWAEMTNIEWGPGTFTQGTGPNVVNGWLTDSYTIPVTPGSTYTFYVQSVCSEGKGVSAWSGPFTFIVPCPVSYAPFTEDFELTTFPPTCWSKTTGPPTWARSTAASGYGIGLASAYANFYSISSSVPFDLMTLQFDASTLTAPTLQFDYAYATFETEVDEMDVYYSTDGGLTYSLLLAMPGGTDGILNTGGATTSPWTPLSSEWATQTLPLPAGTNMILFEAISAYGNNLYLDNVKVEGTCPVPTALAASGITPNSASIDWTENGSAATWDLEYGLAGFSHGSGTLVPVSSKPHLLSGLLENTTYDCYVKSNCGGITSTWSDVHQFTTSCHTIAAFPYTENFDAVTVPALPTCWIKYSSALGQPWNSADVASSGGVTPKSAPNMMFVSYDNVNFTAPKDEWLVTPPVTLASGSSYLVKFWVKAPGYYGPEQMKLVVTTDPSLSGVIAGTVLWDRNDLLLADYAEFVIPFTPGASNNYYFAWHAYTATVEDYIALDDVTFDLAPPEPLHLEATVIDAPCGEPTGEVNTIVTGGVKPYSYLWSNMATTDSLRGVPPGTYYLTVTDNASSTITGNWTVSGPDQLMISGFTKESCFGANNGYFELTVVGGTAPYTYAWSNGASTSAIYNLAPGFYSCHVYDAIGCDGMTFGNIWELEEIVLSATPTPASCPTAPDGSIDLAVTGGSYDYNYLWSNGATTQNIGGVVSGNYSVTVTDTEGCTKSGTFNVGALSPICNDLSLEGDVDGQECFNAYNTIVVAGLPKLFTVKSTGFATIIAGLKINFKTGTKVELNGHLIGKIYTSEWCPGKSPAIPAIVSGQDETPFSFEQANFTLYPNPTTGDFTLVQKGDKVYGSVKLEVYSMNGERVLNDRMVGEKRHEFRFSDVPIGLYFVRIVADDYVETIKLVKTR